MGNVWHEKAECLIKQKILNKAKILLFFLIILQKPEINGMYLWRFIDPQCHFIFT